MNYETKNMQDNPGTGAPEDTDAGKKAALHPPADANSMMMAYAGPAQMNPDKLQTMMFTAYAGPQMPFPSMTEQMRMQG